MDDLGSYCVKAADVYLEHLKENTKGRSEIAVRKIEPVPGSTGLYKMTLAGKLFEPEGIVFLHVPSGKEFTTQEIRVKEYDKDKNVLIVKPSEEAAPMLQGAIVNNLLLIADLRFLVERLRDFFQERGKALMLPQDAGFPDWTREELYTLPGSRPNMDQIAAIEAIMTRPMAYIWGAPGTGKTKFVLAQCILHYLKAGKRVAILAPTNIALEQILWGVLGIVQAAGIDQKKFLRVGVPSKSFADDFPDACEVAGLDKQVAALRKQVNVLERMLGLDELSNDLRLLGVVVALVKAWRKEGRALVKAETALAEQEEAMATADRGLRTHDARRDQLERDIQRSENKLSSVFHRLNKVFVSTTERERRLGIMRTDLAELTVRSQEMREAVEAREVELNKLRIEVEQIKIKRLALTNEVKAVRPKRPEILELLTELDWAGVQQFEKEAKRYIRVTGAEEQEGLGSLQAEYRQMPKEQQRMHLEGLRSELEQLESLTLEKRLEEVQVVGATLDGFVGRFAEVDLAFDHFFLDEAGYANAIKAMVMFAYGKPVTLLGDHKQLPPITEMDDRELKDPEKRCAFAWGVAAIHVESFFTEEEDTLYTDYMKRRSDPVLTDMVRVDLTQTHRFGRELADVLNEHVYRNGFCSASDQPTGLFSMHAPKAREEFKTRMSAAEVDRIVELVQSGRFQDFAILVPYRRQLQELNRRLPHLRDEERILTIHKSQGREWDTVIMSVTDTGDMWFTDTTNTLSSGLNLVNTAVSRAKKELVIVGDMTFWKAQHGQLIKALVERATAIR